MSSTRWKEVLSCPHNGEVIWCSTSMIALGCCKSVKAVLRRNCFWLYIGIYGLLIKVSLHLVLMRHAVAELLQRADQIMIYL